MYCIKCAAVLPEDAIYCPQCASPQQKQDSIKGIYLILAGLGAFMGLLSIGLIFFFQNDSQSAKAAQPTASINPSPSPSPSPIPQQSSTPVIVTKVPNQVRFTTEQSTSQPVPTPEMISTSEPPRMMSRTITRGSFTVGAGQYKYFTFSVDGDGRKVYLKGRFEATGGGRNDVEVYVLNQDGFTNFVNRNRSPTFYNSGRATVGDVYAELPTRPAQTYYLVFSNSFSILSPKAVTANIALEQ